MSKQLFLLLLFLIPALGFAQKVTISGTVKDGSNGEDLISATVFVKELEGVGALTNAYGFFSLTVPEGEYTLRVQYVGYEAIEQPLTLAADTSLNLELPPMGTEIETVQITAEQDNQNVTDTRMSVTKLTPKEIETIPVLFGERDILKTMQLLPGVKTAGEGNSGFFVRGGGLDQNLILLDEAPVYNASHLLGFFSVFNSNAIKDVTLYKGGMPAEYGGRASSVMDIKMKDGNSKDFGVSGGIGLIASNLAVEGPIVKDKGSFMVTGRRTYADLFLKLSSDEQLNSSSLYFYDLNAKANYRFSDKDRVFLSGYFGRDNFGFGDDFGFDWGNATGTIRWNHLYNDKLFSNTSVIFSDYNYKFNIGVDEESGFGIESAIQDWNVKQDFNLFANSNNMVKFGGNIIYHDFTPGKLNVTGDLPFNDIEVENKKAFEGAVYLQNDQKIGSRWAASYGLRYSFFNYVGDGTAYTFDPEGNILTTTTYDQLESIQYYGGFEPRASLRFQLDDNSSLKAAYNRNYQYLHLLSNSTTSTPTDIWVPSSNNVKPQIADQIAVGYFRNFKDNMFEFSAEAYYKNLQNQIDYKNGADLLLNNTIESELVYGKGRTYGLELLLKKTSGRLTGWVSYTLSRSLRTFDEINNGEEFSARQDRIHDISVVAMYKLNKKISLSGTWVYYTGDATTFPSGRYVSDGQTVPYYTERNGYRMPDYHRLDLGLTWYLKQTDRFSSDLNFSCYNAYGRENAYSITFQESETDPNVTEAVQLSLFKWVPSVTYNFKF